MSALMDKVEFRAALEDAIKGREAKNAAVQPGLGGGASCSGTTSPAGRRTTTTTSARSPTTSAYIYANTPDQHTEAKDFLLQNMYEEELADIRHTDLLIKFARGLRHDAGAHRGPGRA